MMNIRSTIVAVLLLTSAGVAEGQTVSQAGSYTDLSQYLLIGRQAVPANVVAPPSGSSQRGNVASVTQSGLFNATTVVQEGVTNTAITTQVGNGNVSSLTAAGDSNSLTSSQIGDLNSSFISIQGSNNNFTNTQIGSGLSYGVSQVGSGKTISVTQVRR